MKKALLIIGSPCTDGAFRLARIITAPMKCVTVRVTSWYRASWGYQRYLYSEAHMNTQTILVTGINRASQLSHFYNDITNGVTVDKKGLAEFQINPSFVFVCPSIKLQDITEDQSFLRRFEVINMEEGPLSDTVSTIDRWLNQPPGPAVQPGTASQPCTNFGLSEPPRLEATRITARRHQLDLLYKRAIKAEDIALEAWALYELIKLDNHAS